MQGSLVVGHVAKNKTRWLEEKKHHEKRKHLFTRRSRVLLTTQDANACTTPFDVQGVITRSHKVQPRPLSVVFVNSTRANKTKRIETQLARKVVICK
jgi:hypothetical protein